MSNLTKKWLTGIPLGLLVLVLLVFKKEWYIMFVMLLCVLAILEWEKIMADNTDKFCVFFSLFGKMYITGSVIAMTFILVKIGAAVIFWLIALVIATDIGGQYGGKFFGKKIFSCGLSKISPNKTCEGFILGIIFAGLVGWVFVYFYALHWRYIPFSICLAIVAQLGDLAESWVKRRAEIKDSGTTFGPHGGVLDRIDGHMAVNLTAAVMYSFV